jgi:hypothetical protein
VPLTCAIIYSEYGRFSEVWTTLLPKLQDNSDKYYITPCILFQCSKICLKSGAIKEYFPSLPSSIGRHNLLMDFIFNSQHINNKIPYPLKLQLYLLRLRRAIRCNPLILSWYLFYLSAYKLGHHVGSDTIQVVFRMALSSPVGCLHKTHYVNLNLFGYLMYLSGDRKLAFSCFLRSFLSNPVLENEAIYHIAIMISDILKNR